MLEFFKKKLKQVDNRARFLSCVLSGDIKILCENQRRATGGREENGSSDVHDSDYEYLTSMTISTLNEGFETKVGLLWKATPECVKSEMEPTMKIAPVRLDIDLRHTISANGSASPFLLIDCRKHVSGVIQSTEKGTKLNINEETRKRKKKGKTGTKNEPI
ncbi:hypothetical protein ZWY2020_012418 [Hordeum vulgare]|nr:hypothetical protein ZWY2020_012418 [Hordeum vulgare]